MGKGPGGEPLALTGFFIIQNELGQPVSERSTVFGIRAAAARLGLPVITLTKTRESYEDQPVNVAKNYDGSLNFVSWHRGGIRHLLFLTPNEFDKSRKVGGYEAFKFYGEENATDETHRTDFSRAMRAALTNTPELVSALSSAGITLTDSAWTVTSDGQTRVPELPRRARPREDAFEMEYSPSAYIFSLPYMYEFQSTPTRRLDPYRDEPVAFFHSEGYGSGAYDMVSWQTAGYRHVMTNRKGEITYATYARGGHDVVTSEVHRRSFVAELIRVSRKNPELRKQLLVFAIPEL